jgi:hypothetical protein
MVLLTILVFPSCFKLLRRRTFVMVNGVFLVIRFNEFVLCVLFLEFCLGFRFLDAISFGCMRNSVPEQQLND